MKHGLKLILILLFQRNSNKTEEMLFWAEVLYTLWYEFKIYSLVNAIHYEKYFTPKVQLNNIS